MISHIFFRVNVLSFQMPANNNVLLLGQLWETIERLGNCCITNFVH